MAIGHNGRAISQSESRYIPVCPEGRRCQRVISEGRQEMEAINHMTAGSTNQLLCLSQLIMWLPPRAEPELKDAEFAPPAIVTCCTTSALHTFPRYSRDRLKTTELICRAEISTERKEGVIHSEPWRDRGGGRTHRVKVQVRHKNTNTRQFRLDRPKASFLIIPYST